MSVMDVEVLLVPDRPNESVALSLLRLAFDRVGLPAQSVRTKVIASQEQAQERGFVGSPTIHVDGGF
jgi:2-hydroxychromene-2-carboxylate isomerase